MYATVAAVKGVPTGWSSVPWEGATAILNRRLSSETPPNDVAFSDDQFKEFHGIDSAPHLAALRRWVTDDELPLTDDDDVRAHQMPPTDDEQRARLEFRIALELRRDGRTEAADAHFDQAIALAPLDFTIRRAVMPLRGQDPFFGEEFLELYEEWEAVGRPYYGQRTDPSDERFGQPD